MALSENSSVNSVLQNKKSSESIENCYGDSEFGSQRLVSIDGGIKTLSLFTGSSERDVSS